MHSRVIQVAQFMHVTYLDTI